MSDRLTTLPAREGKALLLEMGQRLAIVNTHGMQVVDFWAFNAHDLGEALSMPHTRNANFRLSPAPGDTLVTNLRRPILTLVADSSPGIHDTLIPSCDRIRYEQLGCDGYHDNCADNMARALEELGYEPPPTPAPLNLFMNVPVGPTGRIELTVPRGKPGDRVEFRAEMPCIVVLSACPHDIFPINGPDSRPRDVQYAVLPGAGAASQET
jgi:uncharacterized protein YcgI (DUF1989 family)